MGYQEAFEKIKEMLSSDLFLAHYDPPSFPPKK